MQNIQMALKAPLFTSWTPQYLRLMVPGLEVGAAVALTVNGEDYPFQYSGELLKQSGQQGAEVWVRLGFETGEVKNLEFVATPQAANHLECLNLPLNRDAIIGVPGRELIIPAPASHAVEGGWHTAGPMAGYAGYSFGGQIFTTTPLEGATLTRTSSGPLFEQYSLEYRFGQNGHYNLEVRCFYHETAVQVRETFATHRLARVTWVLNPEGTLDQIISRDSFEGESQPTVEPLGQELPRDLLCRLQMPVQTEYFIPNNRGWFAFAQSDAPQRGMLGILGLFGARWREPVTNMPLLHDKGGTVEWGAAIQSGERHWMLYAGPLQTAYTPSERFVFHRLHAEWNALRLDEHLDLSGDVIFDATTWQKPAILEGDYRATAQRNATSVVPLAKFLEQVAATTPATTGGITLPGLPVRTLLTGEAQLQEQLKAMTLGRLRRWVFQFQGYRTGEDDYAKNVIGFTRALRGLLINYELLRKDQVLSDAEVREFNAYFVFCARRILDEGRWPHSRTWLHPDHPESTRDFYNYPGEHRPDKLVWTNSLPNFQSDPLSGLLHLAAIFPEHPDALFWKRFGQDEIDRQLDAYCGRSGAWQESINYALYTFSYFVITFRAAKNRLELDFFQDERFRRFASWLVRVFGPKDVRWNQYTYPALGNAVLPQNNVEAFLAMAAELEATDPLREELLSVYALCAPDHVANEHMPFLLAAAAPEVSQFPALRPLHSEVMDEVGVSLRHHHAQPQESYLFQKIGWAKDHYEGDETSFNWFAKGVPLCMEYGTYTGDAGKMAAHNLVEIPDADSLRRGFLAQTVFSDQVDYTRCEVPITLKLSYDRQRTFAEIDGPPETPKFFYLGDENPVGPKTWVTRQLLWVKPDYVVLLDRVMGPVAHRYNLHAVADSWVNQGQIFTAKGRHGLDIECHVAHPPVSKFEAGELCPGPQKYGEGEDNAHRQSYFRLYNEVDGEYRTLLFAREPGREVKVEPMGSYGWRIITPEYTDTVWLNDQWFQEADFAGRVGWRRLWADGTVETKLVDADFMR